MNVEPVALRGLRRELTRDLFEELGAIQCKTEEILGYIGTTEKKLEAWCRKIYRHSLNETLEMIRQEIAYPKLNVKIACSHGAGHDYRQRLPEGPVAWLPAV